MNNDKNENKAAYLQLIQEPINRMSSASAIYKGFTATIVTGICALNPLTGGKWIIALLIIPVIAFAALDLYYLVLERKFRYLYNEVREERHECDFSLQLISRTDTEEMKIAKARVLDCISSPSIYLFYPLMFVFLAVSFCARVMR